MKSDNLRRELVKLVQTSGTFKMSSFAKALSLIEELGAEALKVPALLEPSSKAFRIGVTGPPGAGKSTLIAGLIKSLRQRGLKVGVLAVDPSSPFSSGALLGDRIRFHESFTDPEVFIRSLGSRGSQGGLSALAYLMLRAFDVWRFDVVLVETVGVGQTELDVMYVADYVVVTLVPEGGDAVQAMKAGLMEIADLFVVNKADRPGSQSFANELKDSLEITSKPVRVQMAQANAGKGIQEILQDCLDPAIKVERLKARENPVRVQAEARAILLAEADRKLRKKISGLKSIRQALALMKGV